MQRLLHVAIKPKGVSPTSREYFERHIPTHVHVSSNDISWFRTRTKSILRDLVTIIVDNIATIERRVRGGEKDGNEASVDGNNRAQGVMRLDPSHDDSEIVISFAVRPKAANSKPAYILMELNGNNRTQSASVAELSSFELDVWVFPRDRDNPELPTDRGLALA